MHLKWSAMLILKINKRLNALSTFDYQQIRSRISLSNTSLSQVFIKLKKILVECVNYSRIPFSTFLLSTVASKPLNPHSHT